MSLLDGEKNADLRIQSEDLTSDEEKVVYNRGEVVCDWAWANNAKRPSVCSYTDNGDKHEGSMDVSKRQHDEDESVDEDSCSYRSRRRR
jgi:hypothetical protein